MRNHTFRDAYAKLLSQLFRNGISETNARTGEGIKMLRGGHSFKIDLFEGKLPMACNRRYFPHIAAVETAWQFMGTQDPEWILEKAPKLWSNFVEEGMLKTAYGYRWREHFGRDQIGHVVYELANNPTNRQLYVSAWDPATDGLGSPDQPKNIPCPVGFSVTRSGDEVHMSVFIRSSDVFVGLPYDVMGYALTLDAICSACNLRPGTIHFTLAHAHYYDVHEEHIKACVVGEHSVWPNAAVMEPWLPHWTIGELLKNPEGYLQHVRTNARLVLQHEWSPLPVLVV